MRGLAYHAARLDAGRNCDIAEFSGIPVHQAAEHLNALLAPAYRLTVSDLHPVDILNLVVFHTRTDGPDYWTKLNESAAHGMGAAARGVNAAMDVVDWVLDMPNEGEQGDGQPMTLAELDSVEQPDGRLRLNLGATVLEHCRARMLQREMSAVVDDALMRATDSAAQPGLTEATPTRRRRMGV
jgi:hypothetical protein